MAWSGKILVVDDNSDLRDVLSCLLVTCGFQVITAEDGFHGLTVAEAECPDLIITDIGMPRLDGIEMIIRLRKKSEFSDVPILVISAYGDDATREALDAGANEAMPKPVNLNSLIDQVNQLLAA